MKNIFLLTVILLSFSCKAQQNYPLDTDYETVPNYSYLKDTNNELSPFVGIWKANFNNQEIILKIDKVENYLIDYISNKFYQDTLFMRYSIKTAQGTIIKSTINLNIQDSDIKSITTFPLEKVITFSYNGGGCLVGGGRINIKYLDPSHIKWSYYPDSIVTVNCPPGTDTTIYLPETADLVFTKQ
jgi:hypothetical protein